jgi:hypothetical protein
MADSVPSERSVSDRDTRADRAERAGADRGDRTPPHNLDTERSLLGGIMLRNDTFNHAKAGDCLSWPERTPDSADIIDCKDDHRFEVAINQGAAHVHDHGCGSLPDAGPGVRGFLADDARAARASARAAPSRRA